MNIFRLALLIIVTSSSFSWGQTKKPRTLDELAAYSGADRHRILVDGAKAEGKVVWYTSLSGVYRELVDAFKRKYPPLKFTVPAARTWGRACSMKHKPVDTSPMRWKALRGSGRILCGVSEPSDGQKRKEGAG